MTEKQYINRMMHHLHLPKEQRERVREDLSQDIRAALDNGETMEQIVARMGKPYHLATELEQNYLGEAAPMPKAKKFLRVASIIAIIGAAFSLVSNGIQMLVIRAISSEAASIGIIGGADGPTSIFVTTAIAPVWKVIAQPVLAVLVIIAAIVILKRTKR